MKRSKSDRAERLYEAAILTREQGGGARGFWQPLMRSLALRGHSDAMIEIADLLTETGTIVPLEAFALYYRAYKAGDGRAAYNLAISYFNLNDLTRYRYWLKRASNLGFEDAALEYSLFETRLPHPTARRIRRLRPLRKYEKY